MSKSSSIKMSASVTKLVRPGSRVSFMEDLLKPSDHNQSPLQDRLSDSSGDLRDIAVLNVEDLKRSNTRKRESAERRNESHFKRTFTNWG